MIKYVKKSNWGDYWFSDLTLDEKRLIEKTYRLIPKLGLQLSMAEHETARDPIPELCDGDFDNQEIN